MYVWFNDSIDKLAKHYQHLNPAQLNGSITGKDRDAQKMKFIENDSCRLMLANVRSGGCGIDGWQKVCSHVTFVEMVSTPGLLEQAISRLHRSGQQHESVTVYFFVVKGTVSVKLRNNLVAKERDANEVVRDRKTLLADLLGLEHKSNVRARPIGNLLPPEMDHDISSYVRLTKCKAEGGGQ